MKVLRRVAVTLAALSVIVGEHLPSPALAGESPRPAWSIQSLAEPTQFKPGEESGLDLYEVFLTDSGAEKTDKSAITITDTLPRGIEVKSIEFGIPGQIGSVAGVCSWGAPVDEVTTVTCTVNESLVVPKVEDPATVFPQEQMRLVIHTKVPLAAAGKLLNRVEAQGGGAEAVTTEGENEAREGATSPGFQEFHAKLLGSDGRPFLQADGHPYAYVTSFGVNTELTPPGSNFLYRPTGGDLRNIEVSLPPGLVGDPQAMERCTAQQFNTIRGLSPEGENVAANECPNGSAVGVVAVQQLEGSGQLSLTPVYNLVPPPGMPAQLGFQLLGLPVYIDTKVRSGDDYGITAYLSNISEARRVTATMVTIWGTPWEAGHDRMRGYCSQAPQAFFKTQGSCKVGEGKEGEELEERPFLRLPSSCGAAMENPFNFTTWALPVTGAGASWSMGTPTGCALPDFSPTIEGQPTTGVADSPSGLHFDLHLPQASHESPTGTGEADLRDATVTLPAGMTVDPSSADGLAGCSEAQIGYLPSQSAQAGHPQFTPEPAECPDASKVGAVTVTTPLLGHPLPGAVYVAKQGENPFGSLVAIYITVYDPISGVVVKLPAEVQLDPRTGQLTTTVLQSPEVPFEDFALDFFPGARAPLTTPFTCGSYAVSSDLTPWSAPEGGAATPSSLPFAVTAAPGGGACVSSEAQAPNSPGFEAGMASPVAGAYSPFVLKLGREDGSQRFSGLNVTLPPGLTGKVAGLQQCSQAAIEAAQARSHEGEGALELSHPSCPAGSEVGVVHVGAGSGAPFYATGHAYFAGPYNGAPFSLAIVTPAVAGPFDLGTVVVRAALYIDPSTAQVTVKSDPFPTILDGIPLDVRSVDVDVSRQEFTLNPTSCDVMSVTGQETSTAGQTAGLSDRFQTGGCTTLPFHPVFTVSSSANTSRKDGASLFVHVSSGAGQANIAKVLVKLPKQLPSRLDTLKLACVERVFAANPAGCPEGSRVGTATAVTPILGSPLTGPAYIVSHGGAAFPDLEVVLQGEGVTIVLDGKTNIKDGITESSFESIPDAPVSNFELNLPEGPHSILGAPSGLCLTRTVLVKKKVTVEVKSKGRVRKRRVTRTVKETVPGGLAMPTVIIGQNGAEITQSTPIKVTGCAASVKKKTKGKSKAMKHKKGTKSRK